MQDVKYGLKHLALEWKAQLFLRGIAHKDTFDIDGIHVTAWEPKKAQSQFDYRSAYLTAIERNHVIFGHELSKVEFVRLTTTDDYNRYRLMFMPDARVKVKGNGSEGSSIEDKIVLIDYSALSTETSLLRDHGNDEESIRQNYQQVITHELAHTFTRKLLGRREHYVEAWFKECLGVLVGPQKSSIPLPGQSSLKERLDEIDQKKKHFPTTNELAVIDKNGRPIIYDFASQFIRWIFLNKTTGEIPLSEKDIPEENKYDEKRIRLVVQVMREVGKGTDFKEVFKNIFGLDDYEGAYWQFYESLK